MRDALSKEKRKERRRRDVEVAAPKAVPAAPVAVAAPAPPPPPSAAAAPALVERYDAVKFGIFQRILSNFRGLVLFCIEADFCNQILIF